MSDESNVFRQRVPEALDTFIGHILQFGFQTNASNGEPSGNFYDNVVVTD